MAELKQIVRAKILMSQILIRKKECYYCKSFRCCSHKYLYCEAGAAALINTFEIGTADDVPARVKPHHAYEKNVFCFVGIRFIELPESNLKIWEKQGLI